MVYWSEFWRNFPIGGIESQDDSRNIHIVAR